jgi:hypothetical protein
MNTKNLFFIIGLVIVLVLSAVACGDDDDNNDNDTQAKDSGTADAGGQDSAVADSGDSGTKPADATMPEGPTVTTPKGKVRGTLSNGVRVPRYPLRRTARR